MLWVSRAGGALARGEPVAPLRSRPLAGGPEPSGTRMRALGAAAAAPILAAGGARRVGIIGGGMVGAIEAYAFSEATDALDYAKRVQTSMPAWWPVP